MTDAQIDAAAKVLREHLQRAKLLRPWEHLPNSTKRKWWKLAAMALAAASTAE